jgi:O-antigen ligase
VLGTDSSLTKRTKIWTVLLEKAQLHPLLGFGYGNFWLGEKIGVSAEVKKTLGYYPYHGHNGFIDLWLELGLIGLLLLLCSFVFALIKGFRRIHRSGFESTTDLWPMVYLFFVIFHNCAESDLLGYSKLMWPLSVAAMANLSFNQEAPASSVWMAPRTQVERRSPPDLP